MLNSKMPWRRVASLAVPLPSLRSWYQAPQKKCKSWAAPLVWQQPDRAAAARCMLLFLFVLLTQRKLWFIYWALLCVSVLTCTGSAVNTGTFAPVDGHSVHRQMLSAVELVLIEAALLGVVQELVLPHCWVCPRNCLFVLKQEEARPASSCAFAFGCESEMLLRSWQWLLISHSSFSCNTDWLLGTRRPAPYFSWFTFPLNHRMTWV